MTKYRFNADGTFDVLNGRRVIFKSARASVTYRLRAEPPNGMPDESPRAVTTNGLREDAALIASDEYIALQAISDGDTLRLRVMNHGALRVRLGECVPLDCDIAHGGEIRFAPAADLRYLHHGWQSWSPVAVRRMTEPERAFEGDDYTEKHLPYGAAAENERTSNAFMLIGQAGSDADALLLGFTASASQFSQIRCAVAEHVTRVRAIAYADDVVLEPGAVFETEALWLKCGAADDLYDAYAERVAAVMGRRGARATLQGWCSWYYYFDQITAPELRANSEALRVRDLSLDVMIVDDGYMAAVGDWTQIEADKFPDGMKHIADEIHAAGMLAGIWLAPFGLQEDSQTAQAHPEFLLRDAQGAPVFAWTHRGCAVYALDLTRADVQDWLTGLIQTICHEWGYDVLKLDFVFAGALPGEHADVFATRAQAYRRGLETIGRAAGEAKILMGCGAPIAASVGLVDTMRVSQDVSILWEPLMAENGGEPSTRHAVQNTLLRAPMNQRWWLNDGDCVMVRARGDVNLMTRHEQRTLASVAALTGSVLFDSDNLVNLKRAHWNDLRRILPASRNTARVREWFGAEEMQPSQFALAPGEGAWVLGAVNWNKRARETVIDLPDDRAYRVHDFWRNQDLGIHRKRVKISRHARHETIVLHCVPAKAKRKAAGAQIARV